MPHSRTVLPTTKLLDLIGIRAEAKLHPLCENISQDSSLPSVREAIRKGPLSLYEDAC